MPRKNQTTSRQSTQNLKIMTIGSLTFDIFAAPVRQEILQKDGQDFLAFPFGEKVRVEHVRETFGGGAANCAVCLARLGASAAAFGATGGGAWGEGVVQNLQRENVNTNFVQKVANCRTGFSVILNSPSGERTVLASAGANREIASFPASSLQDFAGLHLCHLSGNSAQVFHAVAEFFTCHPEKFLSWNPGREQILQGFGAFADFLPSVNCLLLNLEEAQEFSGENDEREIFRAIFTSGFAGICVVTNGRKGARICNGQEIFNVPIFANFPRRDTLGAGDCFAATFAFGILTGKSIPQAAAMATLNAASVVSKFGAQAGLLTGVQMQDFQNGGKFDLKISQEKFKI